MFEENFMFGAATAAHQVEGNNIHSDLWLMEQVPHSTYTEPSLDAVAHYTHYKEDLDLLKNAGLNAYRFTIEWARIEPEKGQFDSKEIEHYREVLTYCHQLGITPLVTLHHFSSPYWLTKEGGWENPETIELFGRYTAHIVKELGELIPYICTINEANIGAQIAKLMKRMSVGGGDTSEVQVGINVSREELMAMYYKEIGEAFGTNPRKISEFVSPKTENGNRIIMKAHQRAREVINELNSEIKVGITLSLHDNQALPGGEEHVEKEIKEDFLDFLPYMIKDDFIGLQNYSRQIFDENGICPIKEGTRVTKMGYEFYPEALGNLVRLISTYWDKEIVITENGLSTDDDAQRCEFIERALTGVKECLDDGLNVTGYLHWSLLDNFEWQLGYSQTFGLIAVDRATQERFPKESLTYLGSFKK